MKPRSILSLHILLAGAVFTIGYLAGVHRDRLIGTIGNMLAVPEYGVNTSSKLYRNKISFFSEHCREQDIVMVGDSITEIAEWSELFPERRIANRGISRATTLSVLERLETITCTNAKKAIVLLGINDLRYGRSPLETAKDYLRLVNALKGHGMDVYVFSVALTFDQKSGLNEDVVVLNELLKKELIGKATYIDLNKQLACGAELCRKYSIDGLHLNGLGYTVWKKQIAFLIND